MVERNERQYRGDTDSEEGDNASRTGVHSGSILGANTNTQESMQIHIFTLFPNFFTTPLQTSILGKAVAQRKIKLQIIHLRDYGVGKHQLTDDRPYGGGPGMVMMIEPIDRALADYGYHKGTSGECIALTSAKGMAFSQGTAQSWSSLQRLAILCGHYEGVDERVAAHLIDTEVRIGDFVLTGGEPAALVMTDAVVRLLPGVLGNEGSLTSESHSVPGQFDHASYTRPESYKGWDVPPVLLSGDHGAIATFRKTTAAP